ncbi:predicted protein [Chaetoceros tenuissimus]|uniref:Uncharacterized protein n=1 Tax=Chaetoceros tenuissimus TaxID=426638 RepID=A0AAD3GYP3_9STRA|nr:predicted protein [Chaetoceros tenuissimus]
MTESDPYSLILEGVMDAMVLLDPPNLNLSKQSTELSLSSVMTAHQLLLDTATHASNIHELSTNYSDIKSCNRIVGLLADLYRAIILSSTLMMELTPDNEKDTQFSSVEIDILLERIVKAIYLLKRLSHFYILVHGTSYQDWHDETLPKSSHALLRECFERKPLMDTESATVFGWEPRIISLESLDYTMEYYEASNDHHEYHEEYEESHEEIAMDQSNDSLDLWQNKYELDSDVSLSFHPKDIAKEENVLLNIALPAENKKKRKGKHSSTDTKDATGKELSTEPFRPTSALIEVLKEKQLLHTITVPFYGICCILKQGNLVLKGNRVDIGKEEEHNEGDTSCTLTLFSNGTVLLEDSHDKPLFQIFHLTEKTECIPQPTSTQFQFSIHGLHKGQEQQHIFTDITFAMDVQSGGSLMDGFKWIECINNCRNSVVDMDTVKSYLK